MAIIARIRIENSGQPAYLTKITDIETGKELEWHIFHIDIDARTRMEPPIATVSVYMPTVDIIADAEIRQVCPCCGRDVDDKEGNTNGN